MNAWSNIEISPQDPEIIEIGKLEKTQGNISKNVRKIRELITRFEVCHFKYQEHLDHIKASLFDLKPVVAPIRIGSNHISKGKTAAGRDKTGRSIQGLQYVTALWKWLDDLSQEYSSEHNDARIIVLFLRSKPVTEKSDRQT